MLTAGFILQLSLLQAQVAVKGSILQADSKAGIPAANIALSNGQSTVADEQGRFKFTNLSAGNYRVTSVPLALKVLTLPCLPVSRNGSSLFKNKTG